MGVLPGKALRRLVEIITIALINWKRRQKTILRLNIRCYAFRRLKPIHSLLFPVNLSGHFTRFNLRLDDLAVDVYCCRRDDVVQAVVEIPTAGAVCDGTAGCH